MFIVSRKNRWHFFFNFSHINSDPFLKVAPIIKNITLTIIKCQNKKGF
jgi:hypothetical protein